MPPMIARREANAQVRCTALRASAVQVNALTFRCPSDDFRIGFRSGGKSLGERRLVRDYVLASLPVFVRLFCTRHALISPFSPWITVLRIRRRRVAKRKRAVRHL